MTNSLLRTRQVDGRSMGRDDVVRCARQWKRDMHVLSDTSRRYAHEWTYVRYEALVSDPEVGIGAIVKFLCENGLLQSHRPSVNTGRFRISPQQQAIHALVEHEPMESRLEAWRDELSSRDRRVIEIVAGTELQGFGYQLDEPCGRSLSDAYLLLNVYLQHGLMVAKDSFRRCVPLICRPRLAQARLMHRVLRLRLRLRLRR